MEQQIVIGIYQGAQNINTISDTFAKRNFKIKTLGEHPQEIVFELIKTANTDKTGLIDNCTLGDKISVYYNIRQNEKSGNYFTSLQAWKIVKANQAEQKESHAGNNWLPEENKDAFR